MNQSVSPWHKIIVHLHIEQMNKTERSHLKIPNS